MECLLPELAVPRFGKRLEENDIREPQKILQAQENAAAKKKK